MSALQSRATGSPSRLRAPYPTTADPSGQAAALADVVRVLESTPWPVTLDDLATRWSLEHRLTAMDRWQALDQLIRSGRAVCEHITDPDHPSRTIAVYRLVEGGGR